MGLCLGKENKKNKQISTFEIEMEKPFSTTILDPKILGENTNYFNCTTISSSKKETGVDNFYILMNNSGLSHIVDCAKIFSHNIRSISAKTFLTVKFLLFDSLQEIL